MNFTALIILFFAAVPAFSQAGTKGRLTKLEKRVTRVEGRVVGLEGGGAAAPAAAEKKPANPIAVHLLKKKQVVDQEKIGIKLYLEFENMSNRRYYAFNGVLVFRDETGALILKEPYGYSDPLSPGKRVQVILPVSSDRTKEYLKFVKARAITASFEKQEVYGAD
ncbi:MAG TPA: hypothetical protein DCS63_08780 [Elusimicrobia bacterium]|nr:hypothetical protein [Elusimicrobiota bacterium]